MLDLSQSVERISHLKTRPDSGRVLPLVGVSGIGGSGKGYIAGLLEQELSSRGIRVAVLHGDDWLNLPEVKYREEEPARHYYEHALREQEMFEELVRPLLIAGSINVEYDAFVERMQALLKKRIMISSVDLVLLEGIFLFRSPFAEEFDLKIWVNCSFEVALERALHRNQEALSMDVVKNKYKRIYHPAQRIHLAEDDPIGKADVVIENGGEFKPT